MRDYPGQAHRVLHAMGLSVVIITKNEAAKLGKCLASVAFADEVIVLDGTSTDGTAEVARQHGARVAVSAEWPGFGPQKNRALALATQDWVLSLDADEWLTAESQAEIRRVLAEPRAAVYAMPRLSRYCGQAIRHAGWYPDPVTRLFRRGQARFSDDLVHERLVYEGHAVMLHHPLQHDSFSGFEAVLDKANRYSTLSAEALYAKGRRATPLTAIGHGLWTFIRTYLFKRGFLDGWMGLALAISNAHGSYYRYMKLWLLGRQRGRR